MLRHARTTPARPRRTYVILAVIALSVAGTLAGFRNGAVLWGLLGDAGSAVVLALHWHLGHRHASFASSCESTAQQAEMPRTLRRVAV